MGQRALPLTHLLKGRTIRAVGRGGGQDSCLGILGEPGRLEQGHLSWVRFGGGRCAGKEGYAKQRRGMSKGGGLETSREWWRGVE